jgi:hypothetical protein
MDGKYVLGHPPVRVDAAVSSVVSATSVVVPIASAAAPPDPLPVFGFSPLFAVVVASMALAGVF